VDNPTSKQKSQQLPKQLEKDDSATVFDLSRANCIRSQDEQQVFHVQPTKFPRLRPNFSSSDAQGKLRFDGFLQGNLPMPANAVENPAALP